MIQKQGKDLNALKYTENAFINDQKCFTNAFKTKNVQEVLKTNIVICEYFVNAHILFQKTIFKKS